MPETWFQHQMDKIVIVLLLIMLGCVLVAFFHSGNSNGAAWAERAFDTFQGALLGLITGARLTQRNPEKPDVPKEGEIK